MNIRISVAQRLNLAFFILVSLIIAAVGVGVGFSISTIKSTSAIRQGAQQIDQVYELQFHWFSMINAVDTLIQTRSIAHQEALIAHIQLFNQQLSSLSSQTIGLNQEVIQANQISLQNVEKISLELDTVMEELNQFATQGRWGSALTLRQTKLARLQNDLDKELSQLSQNIQQDVAGALNRMVKAQQSTGQYWIVLSTLAVIFAALVSWLAFRGIVRPVKHLITDVEKITEGDLSPIQALEQKDEIGDLSRAFSMMTNWLRESHENLERRVEERTRDLEKRTNQIQVAAEVARDITTNRDLESLLNHTVTIIPERFGFYHAGIFMVDVRGEFAVLRAATQETGQEMLRLGHKLRIGETGLVGHVCFSGEPRIALDVGEDAVHFKNPHLPLTRSEIALPLKSGEKMIGALDVQSIEAAAFDQESIMILQVMADQLATAIENTNLLQELQGNIRELERLSGSLVRSAWQKTRQSKDIIGYQYDGLIVEPIYHQAEMIDQEATPTAAPISLPLQIRDQSIGSLDIWPSHESLSIDELDLVKKISNRISQILENARLFEESQNRAEREKLTTEITAQLRASTDPQAMLETAVTELRKALNAKHAQIAIETLPVEKNGNGAHQPGNHKNLNTEGAPR